MNIILDLFQFPDFRCFAQNPKRAPDDKGSPLDLVSLYGLASTTKSQDHSLDDGDSLGPKGVFDGGQNPCEVLSSTHPLQFIPVFLDKHRHLLTGAKHIELFLWHSMNFVEITYFIRYLLYLTEYNLKSPSLLYFLLPVIIIIIPCIHYEEI